MEGNEINAVIVSGKTLLSDRGFYKNIEELRDSLQGDVPIFVYSYENEMKNINTVREIDRDEVLNVKEYFIKPVKPSDLLKPFISNFNDNKLDSGDKTG